MDLRMAVLTFFVCLETVRCEGLLRTSVNAGETHGTMVSGDGFFVCQADVLHRADSGTYAATGTFGGIHFRSHTMYHSSRHSRAAEKP